MLDLNCNPCEGEELQLGAGFYNPQPRKKLEKVFDWNDEKVNEKQAQAVFAKGKGKQLLDEDV
ncbi:hypothetical protein L7F22_047902, partial [Adiantum nelumboides]|nr:hypothetical protein [Adiantum nelumboides]